MTVRPMQDLPRGAVFRTNLPTADGERRYEVVVPAFEHDQGWVEVRNLSMTDDEAQRLLSTPGAVEDGCDPREGVFCFSHPVDVEVLS